MAPVVVVPTIFPPDDDCGEVVGICCIVDVVEILGEGIVPVAFSLDPSIIGDAGRWRVVYVKNVVVGRRHEEVLKVCELKNNEVVVEVVHVQLE